MSHLRWLAALTVVLSHVDQGLIGKARYTLHVNPRPNDLVRQQVFGLAGYGHAAVVVFFVLSGFLVGGKLIELLASGELARDWRRFLIDRFVRIFIVLWPAVMLSGIVVFCLIHGSHAPFVRAGGWAYMLAAPLTADADPGKWAGVAVLLNELVTPTILGNGPLWSLAYEWCYYVMGLSAVLVWRRHFTAGSCALIAYGAALLALAAARQPVILVSGISWLAGVAARHVSDNGGLRGRVWRAAGMVAPVAVLAADSVHRLPDPVLGAALALLMAHAGWKDWHFGARLGDRLARFSYSLYVTHFPVLLAVLAILYRLGVLPHPLRMSLRALALAAAVTLLLLLFARGFASLTEDRTSRVRRFLE